MPIFTYVYGMPRRVRRVRTMYDLPWLVTNHPAGPCVFPTWREAMDYATAPYVMMNSSVAA